MGISKKRASTFSSGVKGKLARVDGDRKDEGRNTLVWFRRDLRVGDNTALAKASMGTPASTGHLLGLYLVAPEMWRKHGDAAIKIDLCLRSLKMLKRDLAKLDIPLIVRTVGEGEEGAVVEGACATYGIGTVHWNEEYEVDEMRRDREVKGQLVCEGIMAYGHADQCVVPPGQVKTQAGGTPKVFTPLRDAWYRQIGHHAEHLEERPKPRANEPGAKEELREAFEDGEIPDEVDGLSMTAEARERAARAFPAGEVEAHRRLEGFIQEDMAGYDAGRGQLDEQVTSTLSPYLTSGMLSARACMRAALEANGGRISGGGAGAVSWMSEVGWRDFYRHILVAFPHVCMDRPYKREYERIEWTRGSDDHFDAWAEGRTGYPIVDAAMRELVATGWLHNRGRMIVASFLAKHLLVDWRRGERFFMERLVDGDFASNNGGWQWSASTGTDAQPYFRIFNPALQGKRFDPDGVYVKRWVPELRGYTGKDIHTISAADARRLGYPLPVVEHKWARDRALAAYKAAL